MGESGKNIRKPQNNKLSERLKIARFQNSLSTKNLASRSDVSVETIEAIESGKILPSFDILRKLCPELKINYYEMKNILEQIIDLNSITLSNCIRNAREQKDITQKELAKKLNISNSFISKIEKGQSFPSRKLLKQICFNLELDYDEMLIKLYNEKNREL